MDFFKLTGRRFSVNLSAVSILSNFDQLHCGFPVFFVALCCLKASSGLLILRLLFPDNFKTGVYDSVTQLIVS